MARPEEPSAVSKSISISCAIHSSRLSLRSNRLLQPLCQFARRTHEEFCKKFSERLLLHRELTIKDLRIFRESRTFAENAGQFWLSQQKSGQSSSALYEVGTAGKNVDFMAVILEAPVKGNLELRAKSDGKSIEMSPFHLPSPPY